MSSEEKTTAIHEKLSSSYENSDKGDVGDVWKELWCEIKKGGEQLVNQRKHATIDYLNVIASTLEQGAQELKSHGYQNSATLVDRATGRYKEVLKQAAENDAKNMVSEIENFAHRRPRLFLGTVFLAGVGAARFFKSSSYENTLSGSPAAYQSGASKEPIRTSK